MDDPRYAGNPALFPTITREDDSNLDESELSATVLHYIDQMLMEEDKEESMFHDSLALQAAEKSFYEVIGEKYPSSSSSSSSSSASSSSSYSIQHHHVHNYPNVESPEDSLSCTFTDYSTSCSSSYATNTTNTSSSAESHWNSIDPVDYNPSIMPLPTAFSFPSKFVPQSNPTSTTQSHMNYHTSDFTTTTNSGLGHVVIKTEVDDEGEHFLAESIGSNEQSAAYMDDSELSEFFDKVLLGTGLGKGADANEGSNRSRGGKSRARKHDNNDEEVVDLTTLLMQCAQAVSSDNRPLANELLMQIKLHSSPTGDGTQRLAHCFANALEARLAGAGTRIYSVLSSKRPSASDMVKAYQVYASACPFDKLAIMFANNSISNAAKDVETIHIVDFGIRYGFKWPALIHRLSKRAGGPPKLRITGIEFPLPGLKLEDTGRCLARYCNRFNVPFEFNAIVAKKWNTIKVEDLNIRQDEFVAVNCMFRFENLLDETVVLDNPRDAVLDLVRNANPNIFVHGIVNGNYDAAFFVTRFREALYHYSALFDMLDTNVARDEPMRLVFEKEIFGREVVNVVACEGSERVERPHTYKKWQLRNMRAGFRQLLLDHQIIEKLRGRLRDDAYHRDFMLHVDGRWMLQGWRGRILHASSCWVPA